MLATTIVNKTYSKNFFIKNNLNLDPATLDATPDKVNLTYILKFGLPLSIIQNINFCLIFNDIHINNLIIILDTKLSLWIFNSLESYQFSSDLVIHIMLKVFYNEVYR